MKQEETTADADRARERETRENGMEEGKGGRVRERERERRSGTGESDERVERGKRDEKRVRRTHGIYMRLGNALIGLSDGFRVAPYRWDRSRFDKIEFHLESAVPRVRSALLHTRGYFILTLFTIVPGVFFFFFFFSFNSLAHDTRVSVNRKRPTP